MWGTWNANEYHRFRDAYVSKETSLKSHADAAVVLQGILRHSFTCQNALGWPRK